MFNEKEYRMLPSKELIRYAILEVLYNSGTIEKSRTILPDLLKIKLGVTDHLATLITKKNKTNYWKLKVMFEITSLTKAELANYPKRGALSITDAGKIFFKGHKFQLITDKDLEEFQGFREYVEKSRGTKLKGKEDPKLDDLTSFSKEVSVKMTQALLLETIETVRNIALIMNNNQLTIVKSQQEKQSKNEGNRLFSI
jgi:hypothetical protein